MAIPVVVYTGKDLSSEEEARLRKLTDWIIAKDPASMERLLEQTGRFLSRVESRVAEPEHSPPIPASRPTIPTWKDARC